MKSHNTFLVTLICSLIVVGLARPFTEEEKLRLKKHQPKWKSPPIDEFIDGNVSKKRNVYSYEFQYKNKAQEKTCYVLYKEKKMHDGTVESQHKWKCTGKVPMDDDLVGVN